MNSERYWKAARRSIDYKEYLKQHDVIKGMTASEAQGLRLMFYRIASLMSREQLCRNVGISPGTLWSWEYGRTSIKCSVLPDLCKEIGVEPNDIITPQFDAAPKMRALIRTCDEVKQNDMALTALTNWLVELRKEHNMSRDELAKRAGICPYDISHYEQDGYTVKPETLLRLYIVLDVRYNYIKEEWVA